VLHRNFEEKPVRDFIDASSSMGFLNKPLHGGVVDKARTKKESLSLWKWKFFSVTSA
jgi:hypothetical protein